MSGTFSKERADQVAGGVFIIGLAIMFMTGMWWPGMLFVIGFSNLARGMAEGREWYSIQGALWMIGLGVVFTVGFSLPLLLILIGLSTLFGYRFRPPFMDSSSRTDTVEGRAYRLDERKPKRKVKNASGLEYYDNEFEAELAMEEEFMLLEDDDNF